MKNYKIKKISFVLLLTFILLISTVGSVSAYTNGKKPQKTNVEIQIQNYHNEWVQAFTYWDNNHNYRNMYGQSGAPNIMTGEYDSSRPNTFGRTVYNHSNNSYSTPFYTYLNSYLTEIVNSSNVRRSTASHEIGHVFGLADQEDPIDSIMNTDRNRETLTYPTTIDINRVNIIK